MEEIKGDSGEKKTTCSIKEFTMELIYFKMTDLTLSRTGSVWS